MKKILLYTIVIAAAFLSAACEKNSEFSRTVDTNYSSGTERRYYTAETRRVVLLYSIGYNTISSYLAEDIEELRTNYLPGPRRNDDVLLVLSHQPVKSGDYDTGTEPLLIRMYSDYDGKAVSDTLFRWPAGTVCTEGSFTSDLLDYIKDNYPAAGYGMVFSSHATGWLPECYTVTRSYSPSYSIGNEKHGNSYTEIDLKDFAEAFPMKFDYILFDACLMGGVEVAYELRNVCDRVGFSQTEILANGFNYNTLTETLIPKGTPGDPEKVCRDYFEQYVNSTTYPCATISYIDCTKLEPLATACAEIFAANRSSLDSLDGNRVQEYFQYGWQWFYDLRDIVVKAGADEALLAKLDAALDGCVLYANHTSKFLSINIYTDCGFSMYLPSMGNQKLSNHYKTLAWNKATSLVL